MPEDVTAERPDHSGAAASEYADLGNERKGPPVSQPQAESLRRRAGELAEEAQGQRDPSEAAYLRGLQTTATSLAEFYSGRGVANTFAEYIDPETGEAQRWMDAHDERVQRFITDVYSLLDATDAKAHASQRHTDAGDLMIETDTDHGKIQEQHVGPGTEAERVMLQIYEPGFLDHADQ